LQIRSNTRAATRLNKSVRKSAVNAPADAEKTQAPVELEKSTSGKHFYFKDLNKIFLIML
jgi:hypothetical protein